MAVPYWDYTVEGEMVRSEGTLAAACNAPEQFCLWYIEVASLE